jgi:phosphate:Na+ symporter
MDSVFMIFNLLGGLAIFMFGMKLMSDNLERVAGKNMKSLLSRVSNNRLSGVGIGIGVTSIIQSSSATTVMLVGFVNIGLMTLYQAAAVIMGANIGTTVTLQITSLKNYFNVTAVSGFLACIGLFMNMFSNKNTIKRTGVILIGFGMIFMGLDFMSASVKGFRTPLSQFFSYIKNPFLMVLFGVIFTGIIQSSSAATVIVAGLASGGAIPVELAMYAVLGMNIGTCITALLSSIGTSINAKRTALIHLMFNVFGVLFMGIIFFVIGFGPIQKFLEAISGTEAMRQIANFHTLFNIITTLMLLPFLNGLVRLSKLIIKGDDKTVEAFHLYYLDERVLKTPPIAVSQMKKELVNMMNIAKRNLDDSIRSLINVNLDKDNEIMKTEDEINYLNKAITGYLVKISGLDISFEDEMIIGSFFNVVTDIERIGDHAENIQKFARKMYDENISFSEEAKNELRNYSRILDNLYENTMKVFDQRQISFMAEVNKYEEEADNAKKDMSKAHIARLNSGNCSAESGAIYLSLATNFERVADHLTNIAESVLSYTKQNEPKKTEAKKPGDVKKQQEVKA